MLLNSLVEDDSKGKIVIKQESDSKYPTLKYILLDAAVHFHDIEQEAKSIVLAGGTMQPV